MLCATPHHNYTLIIFSTDGKKMHERSAMTGEWGGESGDLLPEFCAQQWLQPCAINTLSQKGDAHNRQP